MKPGGPRHSSDAHVPVACVAASHLCLTCNLASHSSRPQSASFLFRSHALVPTHPPLAMAVMTHAVHLNVSYRGGGREPFPRPLPANGLDHNDPVKSGRALPGGY